MKPILTEDKTIPLKPINGKHHRLNCLSGCKNRCRSKSSSTIAVNHGYPFPSVSPDDAVVVVWAETSQLSNTQIEEIISNTLFFFDNC